MSHNVSQTAFRAGKIHPWFNTELALINMLFWSKFKSYVVSLSVRRNPVSGLQSWYVLYYPIQFLWSLVRYPLRYKRRMFRWLFQIVKKIYNAQDLGVNVFNFILRLFRFQYKIRHPVFLSIGKFGYSHKSVRFRVKRIMNPARFFKQRKFMEKDLRFYQSKKVAERLGILFSYKTFFRDSRLAESRFRRSKFASLLAKFKRPKYMRFWMAVFKPLFNLYRTKIFTRGLIKHKTLKKIYWIWLRSKQLTREFKMNPVQRMWIEILRPHMFKYKWSKRAEARRLTILMSGMYRGKTSRISARRSFRKLFKVRRRGPFSIRRVQKVKEIRRMSTISPTLKLVLRSKFNFWRKWRLTQLFSSNVDFGWFFNSNFNLKKINVFRYLTFKPSFYWKAKWKKLFWDQRFWRERRQYPAYFDLINVLVLQAYFRNLGFLFLKVIALILYKFELKRGIVLFWFFNFLGTLFKELIQIRLVYSVFMLVFTGKVKGGTFRTSQLKAGIGTLARQSLSENLQFYFSEFSASAGLFGMKLLTQRHTFKI